MALSVAVGGVGDRLLDKLVPRVRALKIGPGPDAAAEMGPLVTRQHPLSGTLLCRSRGQGRGKSSWSTAAAFRLQGYENGFFSGGCVFDEVTPEMRIYKPEMRIYKKEIFGPVLSVVRGPDFDSATEQSTDEDVAGDAAGDDVA
jgi:malonate-semialdehyde dehydrogenase (acetylating) / methylmalonate-semialdehyde dehydrogenase